MDDITRLISEIADRRTPDEDAVIIDQWVKQGALLYNHKTGTPMVNPLTGKIPYSISGILITSYGQIELEEVAEMACMCCRHGWTETLHSFNRFEPDDEEHICHKFGGESITTFCKECHGRHWTSDPAVTDDYEREMREADDAEAAFYESLRENGGD